MSAADEKPKGFTVTDRRSFTDTGEPRGSDAPTEGQQPKRGSLPPVDFPTFVLSLGSSALLHLGEGGPPDPDGQGPAQGGGRKDLELAKHSIDILSMLEEKTRGNLTATEADLLTNLLFDLRLRYVDAAKSK